ncbi:MAG: choice-of-anchor Q domain-containing protein [Solirubrobacteraceae bacterium]
MPYRPAVPGASRRLTSARATFSKIAITALLGAGTALALSPGAALAATGTTLYVSGKAHTNPACSAASVSNPFATIAGALACAKNGDTVKVGAGTFAGGFMIPANVVLDGAGASQTTISDPTHISSPEVSVAPGVTTTIENLAVSGKAGHNGGIVAGSGSLTLGGVTVDSAFASSSADPASVAVIPATGNASLTVLDSTVSNGLGDFAGGILVSSPSSASPSSATVINSTISGNDAQAGGGDGGGISLDNADLTARDDTIANNFGLGGGLLVGLNSAATVTDSLIATNASPMTGLSDCEVNQTAKITDGGHNLIGIANPGAVGDCGFANATNGDLTGTPATPLNPDLGALAANGGPTQTQALQPGSPAISTGNPTDCQATPVNDLDQRGDTRAATTRHACDIGAYDTGTAGSGGQVVCRTGAHDTEMCEIECAPGTYKIQGTSVEATFSVQNGDRIVAHGPFKLKRGTVSRHTLQLKSGSYTLIISTGHGKYEHVFVRLSFRVP